MSKQIRLVGIVGVAALVVAASAIQGQQQLVVNGNVVSTNVTVSQGKHLVPIEDLAKNLGYSINYGNGVTTLSSSGANPGANPNAATATPFPSPTPDAASTTIGAGATPNSTPAAPPTPTRVTSSVGQTTSVNGLDYTVDSISTVGNKYKEEYDQRGTTLHPNFKTDSLVIVQMTVANSGPNPVNAFTPTAADVTVFDSGKIGYPGSYLDIRQSSSAMGEDANYDLAGADGSVNLMLGNGGKLHFAIIASVPLGKTVNSVTLNLQSGSTTSSSNPAGEIVTVNR